MSIEENKALVLRYFEELGNRGDLSVTGEIIAPEHVADIRELTTMLHRAFPDFHITVEMQIAEGDMVATIFTASGTHQWEWRSPIGTVSPTGRKFVHQGVRVFRVADGKLVETWGGAEEIGRLAQLGVITIHEIVERDQPTD